MPILNSNQYAIALHTSTPQLGIAISNFAGDSRFQVWDLGRDLASHLHQYLLEIISPQTWQDFQFIAVAKGPGGFTGTRVGVVTARTIAQQLDIPLFGISNLAAVAEANARRGASPLGRSAIAATYHCSSNYQSNQLLAVQMDARREQLFVAIYQLNDQGHLKTYMEDTLMTLEAWQTTLAALEFPYQLITAENNTAVTVTKVLDLAYGAWQEGKFTYWQEITPFYGQHPVN